MTTTIDTQLSGALFLRTQTPGGVKPLNRAGAAASAQTNQSEQGQKPLPSASVLAGQIVKRVNQSNSLSLSFKREAIVLTALIDSVAPSGRQQVLLQALSSQVARQEQISAANAPALEDADLLFEQTRQAVLVPLALQGEDIVSLSPQARARVVFDGLEDAQLQQTVHNLGQEAVAAIFGEPSGVRNPDQGRLPEAAKVALPHEVREIRAEQREAILRRITAGAFPG